MAVPAYSRWLAAGKPLNPAQPIADIVYRLKAAYPKAAGTFGWWADDAHYQAVPAQDHTPYSQTGWPVANPEWWVFATDVMHRPDLGVDCNVLFPYWLAEAKAGRMPWVKYLIWQARLYDVRNNWAPQANSGHYDHVHFSARTDHRTTSLGAWSITPTTGGTMFTPQQEADIAFTLLDGGQKQAIHYRLQVMGDQIAKLTASVAALAAAVKAPVPVTVDAAAAAALAKAVNDDAAKRLAQ